MARTTAEAVLKLIKVPTGTDIDPFIETANRVVTKICTSTTLDDTDLELIERWLAAHFTAVKLPRRSMEKADEVSQSFQFKVDLNLAVTTYGQQAMLVDTSGALAAWNNQVTNGRPRTAVVAWLGKDEC